jgi:hypothetical protein
MTELLDFVLLLQRLTPDVLLPWMELNGRAPEILAAIESAPSPWAEGYGAVI